MGIDAALLLALGIMAYNLAVFCVYWRDKRAARKGEWRVQESTLLLLAFAGGGAGALAAQRILRHKTRKPPFHVALPFFFVLQIGLMIVALAAPDEALALWHRFAAL